MMALPLPRRLLFKSSIFGDLGLTLLVDFLIMAIFWLPLLKTSFLDTGL